MEKQTSQILFLQYSWLVKISVCTVENHHKLLKSLNNNAQSESVNLLMLKIERFQPGLIRSLA